MSVPSNCYTDWQTSPVETFIFLSVKWRDNIVFFSYWSKGSCRHFRPNTRNPKTVQSPLKSSVCKRYGKEWVSQVRMGTGHLNHSLKELPLRIRAWIFKLTVYKLPQPLVLGPCTNHACHPPPCLDAHSDSENWSEGVRTRLFCSVRDQEGRQDKPLPTRDLEERKKKIGAAVLIVPLNLSCLWLWLCLAGMCYWFCFL